MTTLSEGSGLLMTMLLCRVSIGFCQLSSSSVANTPATTTTWRNPVTGFYASTDIVCPPYSLPAQLVHCKSSQVFHKRCSFNNATSANIFQYLLRKLHKIGSMLAGVQRYKVPHYNDNISTIVMYGQIGCCLNTNFNTTGLKRWPAIPHCLLHCRRVV